VRAIRKGHLQACRGARDPLSEFCAIEAKLWDLTLYEKDLCILFTDRRAGREAQYKGLRNLDGVVEDLMAMWKLLSPTAARQPSRGDR
jgi:hypothetical protein